MTSPSATEHTTDRQSSTGRRESEVSWSVREGGRTSQEGFWRGSFAFWEWYQQNSRLVRVSERVSVLVGSPLPTAADVGLHLSFDRLLRTAF
eukprot:1556237-Pleurochrysis_carterae.AAC.1